jgi:hypothetical protein
MKSVALIIWLLAPNGQEQIILSSHFDTVAACQAKAVEVGQEYQGRDRKTRHLCQAVVEEVGGVDANGNPLDVDGSPVR